MAENNILYFPGLSQAATSARLLAPSKLRDARKVMRLSQEELGVMVGVTRQSISAYERGDKVPEWPIFQKISKCLGQPVSYFTSVDQLEFGNSSARFYRKFGAETLRRNDACAVLGNWFVQTAKYLDGFVNYPNVSILECAPQDTTTGRYSLEELNSIALEVRRLWGLGNGPISNVLSLLESKGVIICKYELTGESIEAFSFWNGTRPFIFMASEKDSGARVRYDLAHELGHLILHKWIEQSELEDKTCLKAIEAEANKFAGAFLMPSTSFPNEVYTTRLDAFIPLKERWKVSIQAMVHRCRDLDIIDDDQALNLYKQISFRKWRKKEPLDDPMRIRIEEPKLLRRALELILDNQRKHPDEIVSELRLSVEWIEAFCNLTKGTLARLNEKSIEPTLK